MNDRDSERILGMLENDGYVAVDTPDDADLILLNTCSIRANPENKVYSELGRLKFIKDQRPDIVIGVGGCVAQQEGDELLKRHPYLDLVFGTHTLPRLPEMVRRVREERVRLGDTRFLRFDDPDLFAEEQHYGATGVTASVSIQKGCDKFCSFCVVPHVRGREVSRPRADVLTDVRLLAGRGVKEITLLGQNVNAYGRKFREYGSFAQLLVDVADVPGIERVRFTTSHPSDMTRDLIDVLTSHPRVCRHLHLPVQSGSDAVLARMRRGYTNAEYREIVAALRSRAPEFALSSDFIVGYPGESDADFDATLDLVREVGYIASFSFMYSARPNTKALCETAPPVEDAVKHDRLQQLLAVQANSTRAHHEALVGKHVEVLLEGPALSQREKLMGRTSSFIPVCVATPPGVDIQPGTLATVAVTRARPHAIEGTLHVL